MQQHLTRGRAGLVGVIAAAAMTAPLAMAPAASADQWHGVGGLLNQMLTGGPGFQGSCPSAKGGLGPLLSSVLQPVSDLVTGNACRDKQAKSAVAATSQTSEVYKLKTTKKKAKSHKTKVRAHR